MNGIPLCIHHHINIKTKIRLWNVKQSWLRHNDKEFVYVEPVDVMDDLISWS